MLLSKSRNLLAAPLRVSKVVPSLRASTAALTNSVVLPRINDNVSSDAPATSSITLSSGTPAAFAMPVASAIEFLAVSLVPSPICVNISNAPAAFASETPRFADINPTISTFSRVAPTNVPNCSVKADAAANDFSRLTPNF